MKKTSISLFFSAGLLPLLLLVSGPLTADIGGLTVEDVITVESARDFDISPDGRRVVWVKATPDKEKDRFKQNIFLSSTEDTITIRITHSTRDDGSPAFSPDGKKIAFLSKRDKAQTQIYLYDIRGGEPEKLTSAGSGVERFEWRDTKTILYTAREDSTLRERELKKAKDTTVIVADQDHYPPVRLFEFDIKGKKTRRLTTNPGVIREFAVSPDGRWVVTNENVDVDFAYDFKNPPRQFLGDLDTGERHEIMKAPHVTPYRFRWDSESKGFYCRRSVASDSTDTYVSIDRLCYFDLETETLHRVQTGSDDGLGRSGVVVKDGFVAALANGVRDSIVYYEMKGHRVKRAHTLRSAGKGSMHLAAGQQNGNRLVYFVSDASSVTEIMTATIRKGRLRDERQLIDLNKPLKKKTLARSEVVRWIGALDEQVEGILYYPLEYDEGKRYPAVVVLHGGPSGVDRDFFTERWSDYPHLLASKGSFVLKVNYHGSSNYGLRWVESIKEHYYEYEVPDILAGIDALIDRGLVDPNKLGIMGWSNGSILAIEACLQDNRFKVLCAGAGDVNWTSDFGNCAFGAAFDNAYIGGPPWEIPDRYVELSPLFRLRQLNTPTLIMFGTKDTSVPTEQGWQHFRAMQQIGISPVRFLLFPGEGHGLRKLAHQKRKMEEELKWFDDHLFGSGEEENEALDATSPLAIALKKAEAARDEGLYGERMNGTLIPEVVEYEDFKVGRFEITRAQYQAFVFDYDVPPGTENYPANRISYEDSRAYCEWLSERTGRSFRLPTVSEMKTLIKSAKKNLEYENNLERWVGYTPTPDERELLQSKIDALEETRLLFEEVGSLRPVGKARIYDLGGNVAEWVTDGDTGRVMGLSAVSSRDQRTAYTPPTARYVGFRVCED